MKNRVCALLLFFCTMGYAMPSDAIGIRSHVEIAQLSVRTYHEQAAQIVPGLEQLFACEANLRAFYSGGAFPDWGYAGIHSDAAEDSHCRPFHEAYVNVLLARYAPPWTPEAQKEVAFFLGVISHSITDIPWHFSEKDHLSFLAAGLKHDGAGHGEIEMGCDFLLYGERELHPSVQTEAWFPIDTLLAVFDHKGRRKITRDQLLAGTTRAQSMFFGGGVAGMLKAREQREKMPWVCRHLDDYYYGGLEHGAAITSVTNQYYFARLRGWHYYQNMPDYADYVRRNDDYVPLRGISEAHIIEAHPDHNTGGEPFFEIGNDGPGQTRAGLICLDLSEIPPETSIDRAMLWLYFADRRGGPQTAPKTIDIFPLTVPGTQGRNPAIPSTAPKDTTRTTGKSPGAMRTISSGIRPALKESPKIAAVRPWPRHPFTRTMKQAGGLPGISPISSAPGLINPSPITASCSANARADTTRPASSAFTPPKHSWAGPMAIAAVSASLGGPPSLSSRRHPLPPLRYNTIG